MAGVWSFSPQEAVAETLTADVRLTTVSPQAEVSGRATGNVTRAFRLRYTAVSTAEASSMAAFFDAQQGTFQSFTLISPVDQRSYAVRFDVGMKPQLFFADRLRQGSELVFVVVSDVPGNAP